jgi:hypothetical protein
MAVALGSLLTCEERAKCATRLYRDLGQTGRVGVHKAERATAISLLGL